MVLRESISQRRLKKGGGDMMYKTCPISNRRTSKNAARMASFFNTVLLTLFFVFQEPLYLYVLTVDFAIKSLNPQKSPLSSISLFLIKIASIDPKFVDALPKQFALRLGFIVLFMASFLHIIGFTVSAKVFVAMFLTLTFLEFTIGFCIGCYMYGFYIAITSNSKRGMYFRLSLFIVTFISLFFITKSVLYEYTINQNYMKIEDVLQTQLAIRNYINTEQKERIEALQDKGEISRDLYDPSLLSSSYITHAVHENYNKIREDYGESAFTFKIASYNPLNEKNRADGFELSLIEKFNKNEINIYKGLRSISKRKYLYVALPIEQVTTKCLDCHGDPKQAPKGLTKHYGSQEGFKYKIGEIPALISIHAPLDRAMENASKLLMTIFLVMLVVFTLIYFILEMIKDKEALAHLLQEETLMQKHDLEILNKELKDQKEHLQEYSESIVLDYEKAQEILRQQSKMASMGEMLASITHQWKQPIATMKTVFSTIQMKETLNEVNQDDYTRGLTAVHKQVDFMLETMDDFKNFLRPDKVPSHFSLAKGVQDIFKLFRIQYKNVGLSLESKLDDSVVVKGFYNEYRQVLLNIINNARDAYEEMKMQIKPIYISIYREDDFGVIELRDKAGGIPTHVIEHIFDPYMSTKEASKGSGIGLYMSKTIIEENMEGSLTVFNDTFGAIFIIKLPLYKK